MQDQGKRIEEAFPQLTLPRRLSEYSDAVRVERVAFDRARNTLHVQITGHQFLPREMTVLLQKEIRRHEARLRHNKKVAENKRRQRSELKKEIEENKKRIKKEKHEAQLKEARRKAKEAYKKDFPEAKKEAV